MIATDETLTALQAVIQFLQLRPEQIQRLRQLLRARQQAATPLLRGIAEHEGRLRELLESGGPPPEVGQVVIETHLLEGELMRVQQDFLANWGNLLDAEQRPRLESVRMAREGMTKLPLGGWCEASTRIRRLPCSCRLIIYKRDNYSSRLYLPHPYSFSAFSRRTMRASCSARSRVISLSSIIPVSAMASASRPL